MISTRDPFLDTQGAIPCEGRPGYETFISAVGNAPSHDPFSDSSWEGRIKEFLGLKNQ